jgi:serine phosphatase RsbU (regulator of sigma subunit)/DNA-binding response OmpR family regulator
VSVPAEVQGRRLLLVDDNETTRYVFGRWLRRAGFEVIEASTGAETLDILAATTPDLAVLDVNLPDASGFDLMARIKEGDASVPVVHVSATFIEVADRSAGLQRGADAYLVEPVEREELLATVVSLLRYSTARRDAERLSSQLTTLHAGSVDMHGANTVDELTAVGARAGARLLERRVAVAAYAEENGTIALAEPGGGLTQAPYRPGALLASARPGLVAQPGVVTSVVIDAFSAPDDLRALLAAMEGRTVAAMITRHRLGTGVAGLLVEGRLDAESDRLLAAQIVRSVAVAVDNLRLYQIERAVALTLQRALLPDHSPRVPGLAIATRYAAGGDHNEIGGDFYEAFAIDDGHVGLAIGDVQGHSLEAATVMGDLRTALRAYTIEGLDPAGAIDRTNRLFRRFSPDLIATLSFAVLEPATRHLTVANAGHLPLLVATPRGAWWLTGGTTLLGVEGPPPSATVVELPPAASVVFVTDGLIERRDRPLDVGLQTMVDAVRGPWTDDVDATCQALLDRCGPAPGTQIDDIAVMVVRIDDGAEPTDAAPRVISGQQMAVQSAL